MQNRLATGLPFTSKRARLLLLSAVCAVAVFVVALLADSRTFAQNSNTNADARAAQAARQSKRVTPLRGSDTPEGSRVTVTADAPLNDYAAYKSGDRFYVVVPGAANSGGESGGVRGRGYSDVQTQRRGNDLVYSFKLQPGAKARVSQRFNRLDVVFDSPGGNATSAANTAAANTNVSRNSTRETPANATPRNTPTATDTAASTANTSNAGTADAERAVADAADRAAAAVARRRAENTNAFNPVPLDPAAFGAQTAVAPNPNATPIVSDIPPPDELAQAQPPPAVAVPAPPLASAPTTGVPTQTAPTLGTILVRNWGWGLLLLALVFGLGLFFATRGGTATDASTTPPAPVAGAEGVEENFEEREYSEPKVISSGARGGATVASATMLDSTATAEPAVPHSTASDLATGAAVVAPAIIAAGVAGARDDDHSRTQQEKPDTTGREPKTRHIVAPVTDAELDDAEIVSAEVRKLLAGDEHNGKIIESAGDHARTLVGAELVAALAGRDEARRTAAREAFITYGYFDRATHDLQHARASAERASAARALGFVGSTLATPALIRALTDKSPEVRRASVEALAEVRDPAAVPALESRRKHEKRRDMPRQLITRAITACAAGTPATVASVPAAAVVVAPVVVDSKAELKQKQRMSKRTCRACRSRTRSS
jgi:hypothetical protein